MDAYDPLPVLGVVFLLVLFVIGGSLPYRIFGVALSNTRRPDGTASSRRVYRELKHARGLVATLLILTLCVVLTAGSAVIMIHSYVVPIPLVAGMLEQFDLSATQWEYNIEHGRYGDMGASYEEWSRRQGFSDHTARFWQDFLWHYWGEIAMAGLVLGLIAGIALVRSYIELVVSYGNGVIERYEEYMLYDGKAAHVLDNTVEGWQARDS